MERMIIHAKAYPRAGLIGNPSDGYFGKTISFVFKNFAAEVILYQSPELEILPNTRDHSKFKSINGLAEDVRLFGYYGGIRLLKATVKRFHDYCAENAVKLDNRNFTIRYHTNIPSQVGLAGSSAIITACLRALMAFYEVSIPKPVQPGLVLSVEKNELGIMAGLQDRVAHRLPVTLLEPFRSIAGGRLLVDVDGNLQMRRQLDVSGYKIRVRVGQPHARDRGE